jgi:starch-binding outer membrane protein, SusD/RagB family
MKKISFILIALIVLVSSCKKDLNQQPLSQSTTETFYKGPGDFLQALNAVYSSLRGYPDRLMALSEVRSDNIYPTNDVARDHDPINNFSTNIAANVSVEEAWTTDYNGIFRANTILDQINKNGGNIGNATLANRLTAEARFLRAFLYFDLVRYYGKLPIIDHPVTAAEANSIGRSAADSVYKIMIIPDLQFAISNLPANYSGVFPSYSAVDVGRATKYAAEALLGEVYVTRSGPTYGIEGPGLGVNEWALAVPLFNDIIASGQFAFNSNYANIFSYSNQSPTANKEVVFDIMYLNGQTPVVGASFPWQLVPNLYFNSLPSNANSSGSLGYPGVSNNLLSGYVTNDSVRRKVTIHTTPFTYLGTVNTQPFFKKYLDTTKLPSSRFDYGINFIAIRYTDILLLKAECVLHGASGSQATDVDAVVNQVRARAGLPAITNVSLSQLYDERRREFAAEGLRWFDLQRSGDLITIMNAFEASDDVQHKMNLVNKNFIVYPVPQSQIDAAPGLYTQNPGYN